MTFKGFVKYVILKRKKKTITEDYFCNKLRNQEQDKLIKKIKELKFDISDLNLNWNYISRNDNLSIKFIEYFSDYINFHDLSLNKHLTTKHLEYFKDDLEWDYISEHFNFDQYDLRKYKNYINWKLIFFYKNTPSYIIKEHFSNQMWWLFLDDKLYNDDDIEYNDYNNKIMNKNMKTIPKNLIDNFQYTLLEYQRNKIILKDILKQQMNELYGNFMNKNKVITLKKIECDDFRKKYANKNIQVNLKKNNILKKIYCSKDQIIQTETELQTELQTDTEHQLINSEGSSYTDATDSDSLDE
jgi:hypothetical protein